MVINGIENGSPDMIPVAFEGKFNEKKDEIPPGICRPHMLQIFNIGNGRTDIEPKNCRKWSPMGSPMAIFWHAPYYHTPKGFSKPKGTQF